MLPFRFEIGLTLDNGEGIQFSLDEAGWINKPELQSAKQIMLIPLHDELRAIAVWIPEGATPIVQTRVLGSSAIGAQFRIYAVGYTLDDTLVVLWVLPNGVVEVGEEPTLANLLVQLGYSELVSISTAHK